MKEPIGREAEIIRNRRIELGMSQMEVNANMITALRICAVLQLDPYQFVTDI